MIGVQGWHRGSVVCLLGLISLCLGWELWWAPLRPQGSWLVLKTLPLLIPLFGILRQKVYTYQWSSMFILLYFMEGVVRVWSDKGLSAQLGGVEVALSFAFYVCVVMYIRTLRQLNRAAAISA